jgi:hypothetical protein
MFSRMAWRRGMCALVGFAAVSVGGCRSSIRQAAARPDGSAGTVREREADSMARQDADAMRDHLAQDDRQIEGRRPAVGPSDMTYKRAADQPRPGRP